MYLFVQPVCWREIFHGHKGIRLWLWNSRESVHCDCLWDTNGSVHCQLLSHLVSPVLLPSDTWDMTILGHYKGKLKPFVLISLLFIGTAKYPIASWIKHIWFWFSIDSGVGFYILTFHSFCTLVTMKEHTQPTTNPCWILPENVFKWIISWRKTEGQSC